MRLPPRDRCRARRILCSPYPSSPSPSSPSRYYTYNILAELDVEGEYYINRTAGLLYVWLPSGPASPFWATAPWSSPVVGAERAPLAAARAAAAAAAAATARDDPIVGVLSVNGTLLDLVDVSFLTFDGVAVGFGRDVGVRATNTTGVEFLNGLVENVGNMAVNVTGGADLLIDASTVRGAGNGAIFMYAGNRTTLSRSNHTVHNSSVSYSNRCVDAETVGGTAG